jgi:hypothetical protein
MTLPREPRIHAIPIKQLRPTQITVGMREVEEKRDRWRHHDDDKKAEFLGSHLIPVVMGPGGKFHVIDHHHLARALWEEKVTSIAVTVLADLSALPRDSFWFYLENRSWCHLYDEKGQRRDHSDLPKNVGGLIDDPYRSLAGELRRRGGFAKDTTPFSEFLWADFLRNHIKRKHVEAGFDAALMDALELAKSQQAIHLPGWCGPFSP